MNSLKNNLRLLVAAGLMAAVLLSGVSLWSGEKSRQSVQRAYDAKDITAEILPPPLYLVELRLVLSQAVEGSLPLDRAQAERQRLVKEYSDRIAWWKAHETYGLGLRLFGAQHDAGQRFIDASQAVMTALAAQDTAGATAALKRADAAFNQHRQGVDDTVKAAATFAETAIAQANSAETNGARAQYLIFAIAAVVLFGLGTWVRRRILAATGGEPSDAALIANAVARGDLTVAVPVAANDTSSVLAALSTMRNGLTDIVRTVMQSADGIATGASQIAAANLDLSRRTEAQASHLQETAASMEQMSSTVATNAQTVQQASELAASASAAATNGGVVVDKVIATMRDITDSSKRITEIIGVIDGIAFQTNILALNAAVEAARAGEEGRGFAVVAGEVRTLAQRSAEAATQIKALIGESTGKVQEGVKWVDDAGQAMSVIVDQIQRATVLMSQMADATREQASGIEQVNVAVAGLDQGTQQSAAQVEESAAAAQSLREQADRLVQAVKAFTVA